MCAHTIIVLVQRSEDKCWELVFSFHHPGQGTELRSSGMTARTLPAEAPLTGPDIAKIPTNMEQ